MPEDQNIIEVSPDFNGEPVQVSEPVVTPVTPPPIITEPDLVAMKAQIRAELQEELASSQRVTTAPQQQTNELPQEFFDNPSAWIEQQVASKAQAAVQAHMAVIAPYVQRNMADDVLRKVGGDLTPKAQEYARNLAQKLSPGQPLEGEALELVKNATLFIDQQEREQVSRRPVEPVASEARTVRIDMEAFEENNKDRKRMGAKPLTAEEFAKALRD
jgi:hypothetical protein